VRLAGASQLLPATATSSCFYAESRANSTLRGKREASATSKQIRAALVVSGAPIVPPVHAMAV